MNNKKDIQNINSVSATYKNEKIDTRQVQMYNTDYIFVFCNVE